MSDEKVEWSLGIVGGEAEAKGCKQNKLGSLPPAFGDRSSSTATQRPTTLNLTF
jgi:hypothetical protein